MSRVSFLQCRMLSSNSKPARKYLENWVGASTGHDNSATYNIAAAPHQQQQDVKLQHSTSAYSNLILSGASYLLPTLRVERKDTPDSLSERLKGRHNHHQLQQPGLASSWRCPIVLDLSALSPDGSPHYQPPPTGYLIGIINILERHGVNVLGLTAATRHLPPTLEKEAEHLPFLGPGRHAPPSLRHKNKLDLADVIQFVSQRSSTRDDDEDSLTTIETRSTSVSPNMKTNADQEEMKCNQVVSSNEILRCSNDLDKMENATTAGAEENETTADVDDNMAIHETANLSSIIATTRPTVYHGSVRSGQQISSEKGRSLLVLGSVSSGGEVMADGDIFVFGKLRGRALAGLGHASVINDGRSASPRIVATNFDPELVCIGEAFTTIDSVQDFGLVPNQPATVTLEHGILTFQAI